MPFPILRAARRIFLLAGLSLAVAWPACAQEAERNWDARLQATWVWQHKGPTSARYSGPNSLGTAHAHAYTFSSTAFFGWKAAPGLEFWFNPEVAQGVPFSGLHGLGGFPNGEQQKVSGPDPTFYRARLFMRKTWNLGGEQEAVEAGPNQFAQQVTRKRFVLTAGNLALTDVFDPNTYAHDARTQFLNWSFLTYGAFDFAADARGYTWGAAGEYIDNDWTLRLGRFMQPFESNGLPLEHRIWRYYGDQLEIEHGHKLGQREGKLRVLLFNNRTNSGSFDDAIRAAPAGTAPDLSPVRHSHSKVGAGLSMEQKISDDTGVFSRLSWNDGRTETFAFTEIDRAFNAGVVIKGASWGRAQDTVGIGMAVNGLSPQHQRYLALGGLGAFLGDGALNYGTERIGEIYYNWQVVKGAWITADWQRIVNPGYNRDRGPVSFASIRLHFEL